LDFDHLAEVLSISLPPPLPQTLPKKSTDPAQRRTVLEQATRLTELDTALRTDRAELGQLQKMVHGERMAVSEERSKMASDRAALRDQQARTILRLLALRNQEDGTTEQSQQTAAAPI